MVAIIRGSRQTIANRYEMHAEQKRQQALANMPPPGSSVFMMPGCHHHGCMGMGMGMGMGMNMGMGMYGMDMGMYGFGAPPPDCGTQNWFTSFFTGNAIGQGITNICTKLFGNNQA